MNDFLENYAKIRAIAEAYMNRLNDCFDDNKEYLSRCSPDFVADVQWSLNSISVEGKRVIANFDIDSWEYTDLFSLDVTDEKSFCRRIDEMEQAVSSELSKRKRDDEARGEEEYAEYQRLQRKYDDSEEI